MRKLLTVLNLLILTSIVLPVLAEEEVIENKPVTSGEAIMAVYDETGKLVPIAEPVPINEDGSFDMEVPADIPEWKQIVVVIQDPSGEGTPQMALVGDESTVVDPASTAITNTLMSAAAKTDAFSLSDLPYNMVQEFVQPMAEVVADMPPAEDVASSIARAGEAMSFKPEAALSAFEFLPVEPETAFTLASVISDAAAPSFDPFEGLPKDIPDEPSPGSLAFSLIPPDKMRAMMPVGFDPTKLCPDCPPPGSFQGDIPQGTFQMPPGLVANPKVKLSDNVVFPQGVQIPKDFPMPPNAILPPGVVLQFGFVPPAGLQIPPGVIAPEGFDPTKYGAVQSKEFNPPTGFTPPPGFALAGTDGKFMMPKGFALPDGVKPPEGLAMEFPPPAGFMPPPPPPGMEMAANVMPPPTGFTFPPGSAMPPTFNPSAVGLQPPAGFVPPAFGPRPTDFGAFKGDSAQFFKPFGDTFEPPKDGAAPFVPPSFVGTDGKPFDPSAAFNQAPPSPPPTNSGGNKPPATGGSQGPTTTPPPANPPSDGSGAPPQPEPFRPNVGSQTPASGEQAPPPSNGGGNNPPPPPPSDGGGNNPPPPPPNDGGGNNPPPPPPTLIKARTVQGHRALKAKPYGSNSQSRAGTKTILQVPTKAKTVKLSASQGVYLIGKAKTAATKAIVPIIIDPSISSTSVKLNLKLSSKELVTTDIDLEQDATQLITQLDGKLLEMTTAGSSVDDIESETVTGYLLAPGTSAATMQSAITVKGTVVAGEDGDLIDFTMPSKKLSSGVYTIVFQDGEDVYFGKFSYGTLQTRTVKGRVLAPNGSL